MKDEMLLIMKRVPRANRRKFASKNQKGKIIECNKLHYQKTKIQGVSMGHNYCRSF